MPSSDRLSERQAVEEMKSPSGTSSSPNLAQTAVHVTCVVKDIEGHDHVEISACELLAEYVRFREIDVLNLSAVRLGSRDVDHSRRRIDAVNGCDVFGDRQAQGSGSTSEIQHAFPAAEVLLGRGNRPRSSLSECR